MYCTYCTKVIPDNSIFCAYCGEKLPPPTPIKEQCEIHFRYGKPSERSDGQTFIFYAYCGEKEILTGLEFLEAKQTDDAPNGIERDYEGKRTPWTGKAAQMHADLVNELVRNGWKVTGRGKHWFSDQLERIKLPE